MKLLYFATQGTIAAIAAVVAEKLGHMFAPLCALMVMMAIDYITGMLASKAEAIQHKSGNET